MKAKIVLLFIMAFNFGFMTTGETRTLINQDYPADSIMIWEKLNVQCDPKIMDLLKRHIALGKKNGTTEGYRLQLYFGSGEKAHDQAIKIKTEFLSSYPDIIVYLLFKSPDFIVRVGNFRTKSEALKMRKSLIFQYPNAFIVADEITFPDLVNSTSIN